MEFKDSDKGKQQLQENGEQTNEIERSKIGIIRALLEREDPSAKEVDDLMIRRFLRARDLDIEKASAMLLKYLSWRRDFVPNGLISESEIQNHLAKNILNMQGFDKKGRPILVAFASRHKPSDGTLEDFKRFVVYCLDKICAKMPKGHEKFVYIGDLQGWGYSCSDIRAYLACLSILQDCFPERLGKLYIVHAPKLFMTVWKVVYPYIDDNTKKKNKNLTSTLLDEIDKSQLPDIYGGKLPLVPIQDC
ncbi:CRAL-TRIO domain-containing protein [Citrus sinensis]|nr:CRAL-TRIO domain-containing protein [Citrus sinensis]